MATVRRLYVYVLVLVSLEILIWGTIILVRNLLGDGVTTSELASSLAFILVSIPVFVFHWFLAQRGLKQPEERFSGVRAIFFYAALIGTMVPVAQNALAIVNRLVLAIMALPAAHALVGGDQSWWDNLVALLVNLLFAFYFYRQLQKDWAARPPVSPLPLTRRLYRYLWVLYGLGLAIFGTQSVASYLLQLLSSDTVTSRSGGSALASGIAFALVGAGLWAGTWQLIQRSLSNAEERHSQLRLVILYALSLAGVAGVLIPVGIVVYETLAGRLGGNFQWSVWLSQNSTELATGLVFAAVWGYFGRVRSAEVAAIPDTPRRVGLGRLYRYILAGFGLAATVAGIEQVAAFLIGQLATNLAMLSPNSNQLASGLAALLVGAPLWILTWLPESREAARQDEAGDHARRSVVRKIYLYLALFAGVVGVMFSAGRVFFLLIMNLLGEPESGFLVEVFQMVKTCLIFAVVLVYHLRGLREDGRRAAQLLAEKHRAFPALILEPGDGTFAHTLVEALRLQAPELPAAVHLAGQGVPMEEVSNPKVVVLPASLATNPGEALRLWLQSVDAERVVVPIATEGWFWLDGAGKPLVDLAADAARAVQQLAEGQEIRLRSRMPAWVVVLAVIGGLGLSLMVFSLFMSLLQGF